jgi:hypothetical protein
MEKPTPVYFAARGRAEASRRALAEAGLDGQEHSVVEGTPPATGRPTDLTEPKASGTLPFEARRPPFVPLSS